MRQPLTKEAENRIASGLNKVIDLVNGGAAPSDAIVKVATELQLPAGHVPLMVNAYNIGRSEAQRKGSTDLFEKVSEFELADASQVLERMFPTTVKSAGVLAEEWAVSPAYMAPPRFLRDRAKREKLAAAEKAIANPLLDGVSMKGAKGVIVSITGGEDMRLEDEPRGGKGGADDSMSIGLADSTVHNTPSKPAAPAARSTPSPARSK